MTERLWLTHADIARALDCSEATLRAVRNFTRADLPVTLDRTSRAHHLKLYELEAVISWLLRCMDLDHVRESALHASARLA